MKISDKYLMEIQGENKLTIITEGKVLRGKSTWTGAGYVHWKMPSIRLYRQKVCLSTGQLRTHRKLLICFLNVYRFKVLDPTERNFCVITQLQLHTEEIMVSFSMFFTACNFQLHYEETLRFILTSFYVIFNVVTKSIWFCSWTFRIWNE